MTTRLPIWGGFLPLLVIVLCSCATSSQAQEMDLGHEGLPVTGDSVPELQSFEQAVRALLLEHEVPGASLAVARNGKVIFARGYGWADTSARVPVSPHHRFRIASVSKPVTAIAVLQLISEGRLSLDDRPFEIFAAAGLIDETLSDPRILQVTVRHLLRHQGGFDRSVSMDPTLTPGAVAREMGVDPPVTLDQIVGFMALQGLDYDPGSRAAYSNFGYAVLGRLMELITGEVYEAFIKEELLTPLGVRTMMLGRTFPDERPHDEVSYYHPPPPATVPAIPPETGEVPLPDGGFNLEIMAAHGGWIATPTDLLRLLGAVDGLENPPDILAPSMIHQMIAPPEEGVDTTYYAMGWMVRPERDGSPEAWWHAGDLPGTTALLMRSGRTSWALLLNRSPWGAQTHAIIREALESAARQVRRWPAGSS